jgi:hypothetical protein
MFSEKFYSQQDTCDKNEDLRRVNQIKTARAEPSCCNPNFTPEKNNANTHKEVLCTTQGKKLTARTETTSGRVTQNYIYHFRNFAGVYILFVPSSSSLHKTVLTLRSN